MREMVGGCCVCSDDRGWPENPLVYCDGQSCTVAVHQACYGIVTVPTGPWYCRKCESQERSVKVKCELCPSKYGALKRTDNSGWAHVVCALYIPEVRFGNVTTMEPIQLQLIPAERFNKVCYICEENGKPSNATIGACMQCNKAGCKQQFHVTCAQGLGLLCEEAGNYLDNVKYCGYCQHHYSKLKKGGNVKTIPPYKPISTENHLSDSSSEKETDISGTANALKASTNQSSSSNKRKSSSNSKSSTSAAKSSTTAPKSSSTTHQKTVHNSSSKSGSVKSNSATIKNSKTLEENVADVKETEEVLAKSGEVKETKGKKRKANSRTPTPISVVSTNSVESVSVVVNTPPSSDTNLGTSVIAEKKDTVSNSENTDKVKKAKTEPTQPSTIIQQQTTALTTTATTLKVTSPSPTVADTVAASTSTTTSSISSSSIIQTTSTLPPVNSLVVSVPLHSTSLSPHSSIISNPVSVLTAQQPTYASVTQERSSSAELNSPNAINGSLITAHNNQITMIGSETSNSALKINYEKQTSAPSSLQVEHERVTPTPELPAKRSRSQSTEKIEKNTRNKKRGANLNSHFNHINVTSKRSSRSQQSLESGQSTSSSNLPQNQIKESPPSSPSSESLGAAPSNSRKKGRKSAPASVSNTSNSKDGKDNIKLFQNGIHAPHMLGNQLNPNSNMAQKMSDHLNSELEAHSIFNSNENSSNLVGPPLQHRVIASARASHAGTSNSSGGSGLSSMLGGSGGSIPQTLDQLLERQWEQGSQFLMEQAQHFDIASLLSCLHQLRAENLRLEEHVSALLQRRDHLLAVNARLAIPLTGAPVPSQPNHPHTVNNIHPQVASSGHSESSRTRHVSYSSHAQTTSQAPIENGLPPDTYSHQHRTSTSAPQPQPSPNQSVRHSPAGTVSYSNNSLLRQNTTEASGRFSSRSQSYPLSYQPPSASQQQMVIRRDSKIHHQPSTKPS
ncbi:hypothetical protein Trydic_g23013 [Trypoxylus dichotomus]